MPFSPTIRNEALVLAARHCCVCHRYKGLKVEVHHIIQESDGGPNTPDNAIALCFDCHADAGHYNPHHPRGTKFSPDELRLARDSWHQVVRDGPIDSPNDPEHFYCRYFVCKDFESLKEIVKSDLVDFPAQNTLLVRTPALDFLTQTVTSMPEGYRHTSLHGESYSSVSAYTALYPEAKAARSEYAHGQQWLEYVRQPSLAELEARVFPRDSVSRALDRTGVPPELVCRVRAFTDGCGDVLLQEEYEIRPLWSVFLALTNESSHRVRPIDLQCKSSEAPKPVPMGVEPPHQVHANIRLPEADVPSGATIVVPVGSILGPLEGAYAEAVWETETRTSSGQMQTTAHGSLSGNGGAEAAYWGPQLSSPRLRYLSGGREYAQGVHDLDLSSVYVIDRNWMMGSCPHLFARSATGAMRYLGEAFVGSPGIVRTTRILPGPDAVQLIVAELEDETTTLLTCLQGIHVLAENAILRKGDYLCLRVAGTEPIVLTGKYDLVWPAPSHAAKDSGRIRRLTESFASRLGLEVFTSSSP